MPKVTDSVSDEAAMVEKDGLLHLTCLSVRRALKDQTPETLRAYSFAIYHDRQRILLRAHFAETPSDDDLEDMAVVETEIDADFLDAFEGETDIEVAAPGTVLSFLPGGVDYLCEGEPGRNYAE